MTTIEIVLMICGIICVIVSYVMGSGRNESIENQIVSAELTPDQKESIQDQINLVVEKELEALGERTEVTLEKISNTKILEMNEYADTVLSEINRNHNETVFLYDMLNEKAKEVKTTVKDVNVTKKQVEKMQAEVSVTDETFDEGFDEGFDEDTDEGTDENTDEITEENEYDIDKNNAATAVQMLTRNISVKHEEKAEITNSKSDPVANYLQRSASHSSSSENNLKSSSKPTKGKKVISKQIQKNVVEMNIRFEKGANNNDKVLRLYKSGKSNRDIAKELSLGVGEVKLVIDLYNSGK